MLHGLNPRLIARPHHARLFPCPRAWPRWPCPCPLQSSPISTLAPHRRAGQRQPLRHHLAPTLVLALVFIAWERLGGDRWLADLAGNANGFALRNHWLLEGRAARWRPAAGLGAGAGAVPGRLVAARPAAPAEPAAAGAAGGGRAAVGGADLPAEGRQPGGLPLEPGALRRHGGRGVALGLVGDAGQRPRRLLSGRPCQRRASPSWAATSYSARWHRCWRGAGLLAALAAGPGAGPVAAVAGRALHEPHAVVRLAVLVPGLGAGQPASAHRAFHAGIRHSAASAAAGGAA